MRKNRRDAISYVSAYNDAHEKSNHDIGENPVIPCTLTFNSNSQPINNHNKTKHRQRSPQ